jgi:predicted ATPase
VPGAVIEFGGRELLSGDASRLGDALVVADNCEHVLEEIVPLMTAWLSSNPRLTIVATSREPLGVHGETRFEVEPLPVVEEPGGAPSGAMALLWARAQAAAPALRLTADTWPSLLRICHAVDGLPLALELAAPRLALTDPGAVAAELARYSDVPAAGARGGPARHHTMESALDWSYAQLSGSERRALHAASVFRGGFDRSAFCRVALAGDESAAAEETLDTLVRKSLVRYRPGEDGGRYGMLEPIRRFGRARAAPGELDRAARSHLVWALERARHLARQFWIDRRGATPTVDSEHANLIAAMEFGLRSGSREDSLRILGRLGWIWSSQGTSISVEQLTAFLGDVPRPAGAHAGGTEATLDVTPRTAAQALVAAAMIARNLLAFEVSNRWALAAVDCATASGHLSLKAWTVHEVAMGRIVETPSKAADTIPLFEQMLELATEADESLGITWAWVNLGWARELSGDFDGARPFYEGALRAIRETGVEHALGAALRELGCLEYTRGQRGAGLKMMDQAIAHYRADGDRFQLSNALVRMAFTVGRDDPLRALDALDEVLALVRYTRAPFHVVSAATAIVQLNARIAPSELTVRLAQHVLAITGPGGYRPPVLPGEPWTDTVYEVAGGIAEPVSWGELVRTASACLQETRAAAESARD